MIGAFTDHPCKVQPSCYACASARLTLTRSIYKIRIISQCFILSLIRMFLQWCSTLHSSISDSVLVHVCSNSVVVLVVTLSLVVNMLFTVGAVVLFCLSYLMINTHKQNPSQCFWMTGMPQTRGLGVTSQSGGLYLQTPVQATQQLFKPQSCEPECTTEQKHLL